MADVFIFGSSNGAAPTATTITRTATYTAGDRIVVWLKWYGDTATVSVTDSTHTFAQIGGYVTESGGRRSALFEANGVAGGSFTITATFSVSVIERAIAYWRATGLDTNAGQTSVGDVQDTVGTTTDEVTTTTMTPTSQPNVVFGVTWSKASASTISAGTGFTSLGNIPAYDAIAGDTSLAEYKRTTSTSAVAATFTLGSSDSMMSIGAVFGEAAGGTDTALTVTNGALTLAGQDVTLTSGNNVGLSVTEAALALSGQDVQLQAGSSFTLPVTAASLSFELETINFSLDSPWTEGSLTFTGQNVTLTAAQSLSLAVTEGALSFTGSDVSLLADFDFTLDVTNGALTLTGQDVTFLVGAGSVSLQVDSNNLLLTSQDIGISPSFTLPSTGAPRRKRHRGIRRLLNTGR